MQCSVCIAVVFLCLSKVKTTAAKSVGYLPASPAILRLEKYGGSYKEMCPTAFYVSTSRLPNNLAKAVSSSLVDLMPSDGCPSAYLGSSSFLTAAELKHESKQLCPLNASDSSVRDSLVMKAIPGLTTSGKKNKKIKKLYCTADATVLYYANDDVLY